MTNISDDLYVGSGGALYQTQAGLKVPILVAQEFGAVAAAAPTGVATAQTADGGSFMINGSLVVAGVAVMDVERTVTLTSTGNASAAHVTIFGKDMFGRSMTQTMSGPNANTVETLKAFKQVTAVTTTGTLPVQVSIGSGNSLGLSANIPDAGKFILLTGDGVPDTTPTITPGLTPTGVATVTNGDVRGTVKPTTAPNGIRRITALYIGDPSTTTTIYGPSQV